MHGPTCIFWADLTAFSLKMSFAEMLRVAAVAGGGPLVVLFVMAQLVLIVIGVFFYSRARLAVQTEIDRKMRAASNQHKLKDLG